jgi:inositol transport system permease protein
LRSTRFGKFTYAIGVRFSGVVMSGFIFICSDAEHLEMVKGVLTVAAVVADQYRNRNRGR